MAVIVVVTVQPRPWSASLDPALPEGAWVVEGLLVGDATGGQMNLQLDFQKSTDPLSARLFNLEQFNLTSTSLEAAVTGWELQTFNLEAFERAAIPTRTWSVTMVRDRPNAQGAANRIEDLAGLPIFLGAPIAAGSASGISFVSDNQDGVVMRAFAQGFFWGPAALIAPGGPQRPLRSVYG